MKIKIIMFLSIAGLGSVILEAKYPNPTLARKALAAALAGNADAMRNALKEFNESGIGVKSDADSKKLAAQVEQKLGMPIDIPGEGGPEIKPIESVVPAKANYEGVKAAATQVGVAVKTTAAAGSNLTDVQKRELDGLAGVNIFIK